MNGYYLQPNDRTSVMVREDMEKSNERRERLLEQQFAKERRQIAFNNFDVAAKQYLLSESLFHILKNSLPKNTKSSLLEFGRAIVESFVEEENYGSLITGFKTKTLFLSELASIIESSHKAIIHGCGDQEEPFKIKNSDMANFSDKIKNLDSSEISQKIMTRVADAEKDFIAANVKDKKAMDDLAEKTQAKIDKIQNKDDELEEELKQECAAVYHQQVKEIINRPKSILESIVTRLSESVMKNDSIREQYSKDGKIDINRIIEMSEVMYTFLEMVNTTKIKTMTPEYVQEVIESIE